MKKAYLPVLLLLMLLIGGCASYAPQSLVSNQEHPLMVVNATERGKVVALPVITKEDGKKIFDTEGLNRKGLVPVYLSVTNSGKTDLTIKSISLVNPSGGLSKKLTASEAADSIKRSVVMRAVGWFLFSPVALSPITSVASAWHAHSVNKKIVEDLQNKQFKMDSLSPGETRTGYVYFEIDEETEPLEGFKLIVELEDDFRFELPLRGKITGK